MIGALRQRAAIEARTLTPDGGGGFSEDWTRIADAWVRVAPVSGRDAFGPDRTESKIRIRIMLRRNSTIAAGQRVVVGTRIFAILAVLDEGGIVPVMTLLCEERP